MYLLYFSLSNRTTLSEIICNILKLYWNIYVTYAKACPFFSHCHTPLTSHIDGQSEKAK